MRKAFIISCLLIVSTHLFAQSRQSIRVKAGEDLAQAVSSSGFYRFPQFEKALLLYTNGGKEGRFAFNYNFYSDNLQFIGPLGDTLEVSNASTIDSIVFREVTFIYRNGYHEVVGKQDSIRLLRKVTVRLEIEKIGGYGQANPTASIDNLRNIALGNNFYNLTLNQDVVVHKNHVWFWMDGKGNIVKANKSNLFKMLSPAQQTLAENYLKQQKVNFEKEADLQKLLAALKAP